jgi:hypothetical protein
MRPLREQLSLLSMRQETFDRETFDEETFDDL